MTLRESVSCIRRSGSPPFERRRAVAGLYVRPFWATPFGEGVTEERNSLPLGRKLQVDVIGFVAFSDDDDVQLCRFKHFRIARERVHDAPRADSPTRDAPLHPLSRMISDAPAENGGVP